ncbi:Uncharacterized oxidoreductase [Seminavis robusta]|uniref:Uncharacterized oxidoreductase n=1 Tax=Seminavis robusta TaxID=568900 RepID=A0A9N8E5J7_9STRA|nr:Uncharacterized oxidoreductase [Seminavis robusta]|eukprot:Sro642_g180190.1 Uncharacterized oxidoreductase (309) ;mRNA; f:34540-35466
MLLLANVSTRIVTRRRLVIRSISKRSISSTHIHLHLGHHTPDRSELPPREDDGSQRGVALIVGAGDALGSALAHKFAKEGLVVAVVRRDASKLDLLKMDIESQNSDNNHLQAPLFRCETFPADARKEDQMEQVVERIENTVGPIQVAIHNIGANVRFSILDPSMTANKYFKVWEMAALSAFVMGRAVAAKMQPRGSGSILFTGATSSVRGSSHFCAFAGAMHAKRALAQSMARELGPQGIHVAHVLIDGGIQTEFVKRIIGDDKYQKAVEIDGLLEPEAIAENYWNLHQQPRVAWTHELDLRPWIEKW